MFFFFYRPVPFVTVCCLSVLGIAFNSEIFQSLLFKIVKIFCIVYFPFLLVFKGIIVNEPIIGA